MDRNFVIAVDFDGVMCADAYPEIGEPNMLFIGILRFMKKLGVELILWTCRRDEPLRAAVEFSRSHGVEFDAVNENLQHNIDKYGGDTRKISADLYIDDKSVSFPFDDRGYKQLDKLIRAMDEYKLYKGVQK